MNDASGARTGPLLDLLFEEPTARRCLVGPDGTVLRVNSEWLRSTGLELDDVLGANIFDLSPETRDVALAMHARVRASLRRVEVPRHAQRVGGRETWWAGTIDPVPMEGGTGLLVASRQVDGSDSHRSPESSRDLADREPAGVARDLAAPEVGEAKLSESEERLRAAFAAIPDAIAITRVRDGSYLLANDGFARLFGWTPGDLTGRTAFDLNIWADTEDRRRIIGSLLAGEPVREVETAFRRRDGSVFAATLSARVFTVNDELFLLAIARDISDRKLAEEALRASEAHLRTVLENSRDGVYMLDLETGRYAFMSPAQVELTGFTADELRDMSAEEAHERVHPDDREISVQQQRDVAAGRDPGSVAEYRWKVKSGEYRWFADSRRFVRDDRGQPTALVGVSRDVTERKRAEEVLVLMTRLYAVLSRVNEAIVRIRDERSLYEEVCRIAAEDGEFPLVWVGLVQQRQVAPVASWGSARGFMREVRVEVDGELGQGPTGTCIREDRPVINDDFGTHPSTLPWRELASKHGLRASAAFPLHCGGQVVGALTFYAARAGAFTLRQVDLLESLCSDVSFALDALRQERLRREAERALEESEARFRALVQASSDVVYRMNADWTEMRQLRGRGLLTDAEAPNRSWLPELIHPEDRSQVMAAIGEAIRHRTIFQLEHRVLRADGSVGWTLSRAVPIQDARGEVLEWFGAASDLTERKLAEEAVRGSERALRALADSMPQLAWTAQPDGYITWYNRRWYEYTGTTPQQMEGWGWQSVHDPRVLPDVLRRWRDAIATGTAFDMEFPLRGAGGGFRRFLTRVFPLKDDRGKVLQWFGTNTDVTELVEAQEALREADRRKDEFLAVLSHELRNPLAPIRNGVHLLRLAPAESDTARRAREVIERQTEHLTRLVEDLLDITRISHGKIELRFARIDARDVARHVCDDLRTLFDAGRVELRYSEPVEPTWVDADAARLAQMIGNLARNALKFTQPGGGVQVAIRARGQACEVSVRDTGAGIEPRDLQRIFEPFVQVGRARPGTVSGLGIGLALVKDLATRHGGSVRAESDGLGKGSEFVLTLPIAAAPTDTASKVEAGRSGSSLSVVVVDDHEDAGLSLAELLGLIGHEARVVGTGRAGVETVSAHAADVLICDVGLPDLSGYEVVRALRSSGSRVFAIALTGFTQPKDRARALEAGFDAHLAKPPPLDELTELLAQAARRKS